MANTPTPYMEDPIRLPCSRCCALDFLWLIDTWEPLCLVCAASATGSVFLSTLLNQRVNKRAIARAQIGLRARSRTEQLPKAG